MLLFPPKKNHLMRGTKRSAPLEREAKSNKRTSSFVAILFALDRLAAETLKVETLMRLLNRKSFSCALIMTLFVQL